MGVLQQQTVLDKSVMNVASELYASTLYVKTESLNVYSCCFYATAYITNAIHMDVLLYFLKEILMPWMAL